jgi:hypothetical protein
MTLLNYIKTQFIKDLQSLEITTNEGMSFFGGQEWENFEIDTAKINPKHLAYFCFCLFSMTCADQNMHSNFKFAYRDWLKKSQYPKFGWYGFGNHFEKPKFLLEVSEQKGVDFNLITDQDLNEFVDFNFNVSLRQFGIDTKTFFKVMMNDIDFNSETSIFQRLKKQILQP